MNLIEHSVAWLRGEIVEHTTVGTLGLLIVAIAIINWKFGTVPTARSMVIPFLIVGGLFIAMGAAGSYVNYQRIETYQQRYEEDPVAFLQAEDDRTIGFLGWYRYTLAAGFVAVLAGLALFFLASGPTARGISLALMLVGFGGLAIDNLSEDNAKRYRAAIVAERDLVRSSPP